MRYPIFVLALVSGIASSPARAAETFDVPKFDEFVAGAMRELGVPGASVAITHRGKIVVAKGYGVRQFGAQTPVDEHTAFVLASVTKTFTATLVASCVSDDLMKWDEPVVNYLPELVLKDWYATRNATARDFLAHRSGLPRFTGDLFDRLGYSRAETLRRLRYVTPGGAFREEGNYSNLGYFSVGMAAAKVGGASWEELIEKRLLVPMGMKETGFTHAKKLPENRASAHVLGARGELTPTPWPVQEALAPAGAMSSTAADMVKFMKFHLADGELDGARIVSAAAIHELRRPAIVLDPDFTDLAPVNDHCGFSYAMGWTNFIYQGKEVVEKGGALAGMRSIVTLAPSEQLGVTVLANRNLTVLPEAVRAYVLEQYLGKSPDDVQGQIRAAHRAIEKALTPAPRSEKKGPPATLPLEKYVGRYESELYGDFEIVLRDGHLHWEAGRARYGAGVRHVAYDNFELDFPPGVIALPEPVTFVVNGDGAPTLILSELFGEMKRKTTKPIR